MMFTYKNYFLAFVLLALPMDDHFHFIVILNLYNFCKSRTRSIQKI